MRGKCKHAKERYRIYEKTQNKHLEIKNTTSAIKNTLDKISSRLDIGGQKINKLKNIAIKTMQNET